MIKQILYILDKKQIDNGIKWIFSLTKKQKNKIDRNPRDIAVKNYKQSIITKKYIEVCKDIIKKNCFKNI
tara:strand:+ start:195 stop:404 length:210 start_codon:yes stop_codon:yes gene_type:complete